MMAIIWLEMDVIPYVSKKPIGCVLKLSDNFQIVLLFAKMERT